nr:class D beta-lactamase [Tenacibaculum ovolyticum]
MKIKVYILLLFVLILTSCSSKVKKEVRKSEIITSKEIQVILDSAKVNGVILIYNSKEDKYYSNNFTSARKGYIPASTFKIPNSIIGLETQRIKGETSVFKWNGKPRAFSMWEKDLVLKEAFQRSCVPCYQELARKTGEKEMNKYLDKFQFGNMDVNAENIDDFWLLGKSKITPFEQIDFLTRFYQDKLSISKRTTEIVKNIMKVDVNDAYVFSGKTGLAIREGKEIGWFVGYVEVNKNVFYFATRITPVDKMTRSEFTPMRQKTTILALKELKIINE